MRMDNDKPKMKTGAGGKSFANSQIIMPTDASANELGGPSSGPEAPIMGPTDVLALGSTAARSGAMGGSSVAPHMPSDPWAVAAKGTESAVGPLASKLKSKFRRGN